MKRGPGRHQVSTRSAPGQQWLDGGSAEGQEVMTDEDGDAQSLVVLLVARRCFQLRLKLGCRFGVLISRGTRMRWMLAEERNVKGGGTGGGDRGTGPPQTFQRLTLYLWALHGKNRLQMVLVPPPPIVAL